MKKMAQVFRKSFATTSPRVTVQAAGAPCGWDEWPEDPAAAFYGHPHDQWDPYQDFAPEDVTRDDPAEPSTEEADFLKQEGEAVALAAEANRISARAGLLWPKCWQLVATTRWEASLPGSHPARTVDPAALRCLICGQAGHLFRECPRRFQGPGAAAMYQKGFPRARPSRSSPQKGKPSSRDVHDGGCSGRAGGLSRQQRSGPSKPECPDSSVELGSFLPGPI